MSVCVGTAAEPSAYWLPLLYEYIVWRTTGSAPLDVKGSRLHFNNIVRSDRGHARLESRGGGRRRRCTVQQ